MKYTPEYAKTPNAKLNEIAVEMLKKCPIDEWEEFVMKAEEYNRHASEEKEAKSKRDKEEKERLEKEKKKKGPIIQSHAATGPVSIVEVRKSVIGNLMNFFDQTTQKTTRGLKGLAKMKYTKEVDTLFKTAKDAIAASKDPKEMESIYLKATEDLMLIEPKVKY